MSLLNRPHRSALLFVINEMRQITHGNTGTPLSFENDHKIIFDDSKGLMADFWPFTLICAKCPFMVKYDRPKRAIEYLNYGECGQIN